MAIEALKICKFDALTEKTPEVPGVIISITDPLPKFPSDAPLEEAEAFYDHQAVAVARALLDNLPQGTMHRVVLRLMEGYATRNLYRGKTGT